MPKNELTGQGKTRTLDARPDRIDIRDRLYRPTLVSLPPEYPVTNSLEDYFEDYASQRILNQGREGACTGFGLAATINYLIYRRNLEQSGTHKGRVERVSPRMLYHLARIYDEWAGEDYEGSSCRGAMKGWHRHGVCRDALWPYRDGNRASFVRPLTGWQNDAATRPLGAYYRVDRHSISDMQAALNEVGALYVSAKVHPGWLLDRHNHLPSIPFQFDTTGAHAFSIVGYNAKGFIVQNSWGQSWGFNGFAVMSYRDWVSNGVDVWVAVLGAPIEARTTARTFSNARLAELYSGRSAWHWKPGGTGRLAAYNDRRVEPIDESTAYEHTVLLGNRCQPLNRFLDVPDAAQALDEVANRRLLESVARRNAPQVVLVFMDWLHDEQTSIKRIRVLAPYFKENGIHPIFVAWKTTFSESFHKTLEETLTPVIGDAASPLSPTVEAQDRAVEAACDPLMIKAMWNQWKRNALASMTRRSGLREFTDLLSKATNACGADLHIVAYSTGAIAAGRQLKLFEEYGLAARTCSLIVPACPVAFALKHFRKAVRRGVLPADGFACHILSDPLERSDRIGPYNKSLLYLASRALENVHKTPMLGMAPVWDPSCERRDMWHRDTRRDVADWREFQVQLSAPQFHGVSPIFDGYQDVDLGHTTAIQSTDILAAILSHIRGGVPLRADVEKLPTIL